MSRRRATRPEGDHGRRRPGWREFRQAYPRIVAGLALFLALLAAADLVLAWKWLQYGRDTRRLRAAMSRLERDRADVLLQAAESQVGLLVEMARLQAQGDTALNLAVSVEEGRMYLQREGARLRDMPVKVGPEARVGQPPDAVVLAVPRGKRAVVRVLTGDDHYELPAWAWSQRGLAAPARRSARGALGPVALVLSGATVIYSLPAGPPLDDPSYVMPGSVRAEAADLQAILENVRPGMPVYFH